LIKPEFLYSAVPLVQNVDGTISADCDRDGIDEVAFFGAFSSPNRSQLAIRSDHLNPIILGIGDKNVALEIEG